MLAHHRDGYPVQALSMNLDSPVAIQFAGEWKLGFGDGFEFYPRQKKVVSTARSYQIPAVPECFLIV